MATDISASLPWLDLAAGSTITVETGDAAAIITQLNVYTYSVVPVPPDTATLLPPLLVHQPLAGTESPGLTR